LRLTGGAGQGVWIAKASNSSKGVGIKLVERLAHAEDCRGAGRVLQKYIENPALLPGPEAGPSGSEAGSSSALPRAPGDAPGGRKFDVRCWVRPLSPPRLRAYFVLSTHVTGFVHTFVLSTLVTGFMRLA
jgi:hypothetical protein